MTLIPIQTARASLQVLTWTPANAAGMFLRNRPGTLLIIWNRGNVDATPTLKVKRPTITAPLAGTLVADDKTLTAAPGLGAVKIGGEYNDANGIAALDLSGLGAATADVFLAAIRPEGV